MIKRYGPRTLFSLLTLLLLAATPAFGQMCVGFPTAPGEQALALNFNTLTGGNRYGIDGNVNFADEFSAFGGVSINDPDPENVDNSTSVGVGAAFFATTLGGEDGAGIQACPTASLVFADTDNTDIWSVPVGVGFGTSYQLGESGNTTLQPWILPAIAFSHFEETDTDFQISLGANVGIGERFFVGGTVNRVFVEGADSEFGIQAGLTF
jgi:hypothetical protein